MSASQQFDELVWEEPPQTANHRSDWIRRLEPLLQHPNEWARLRTYATTSTATKVASLLRTGKGIRRPPGRWEFVTRKLADKGFGLYARYLGPEDSA